MSEAWPIVLGTAGHIDHGKTTLVHALTGIDTDRLADYKRPRAVVFLDELPRNPTGKVLKFELKDRFSG